MKQTVTDAYRLMHNGAKALAIVESNGMRIDVDRMDATIADVGERIKLLVEELKNDVIWKTWKRLHGQKAKLGSRDQLGKVLYGEMGYKSKSKTKTGRPQVDVDALKAIGLDFTDKYLEVEKLKKLQSTYLKGIRREVVDGYLHPVFNLHFARTYRSSSDSPNFQNIPIRDPEMGKLIRSCFIPRKNHVLVEVDYGALEFKIAACFWKDENMVAYASDPNLDIHRDMAAECYAMETEQVTKMARFHAKNSFVFATLYGSYYANTAKSLWASIKESDLKTVDGMPLKQHLAEKGIDKYSYENHIKQVERSLNDRFATWSKRKEKWLAEYQKTGGFDLMTGFRVDGVFSRNQIMNTPIQGPAFHILLWSLTKMVRWLKKQKMRSLIIGQIHDSIIIDAHKDELDAVLSLATKVMTIDVRKAWSWIITPLEIEIEIAEKNWWEKKEIVV